MIHGPAFSVICAPAQNPPGPVGSLPSAGSPSAPNLDGTRTDPPYLRTSLPPIPSGLFTRPVGPVAIRRHAPESRSPTPGGERGLERPPLFLRKSGPGVRTSLRTSLRGSGSLPARACGARHPCGKATNPPAAGGPASMRTKASRCRSPRRLATVLARSPMVGSRRASARSTRAWSTRAMRGTTTARRWPVRAPVRGFGGLAPDRSMLRQRRGKPGVQKGGGAPLASAQCSTLGLLALPP